MSINYLDPDRLVLALPPYTVEEVGLGASGEVIDWGLKLLSVPNLWRQTQGQGIKIAVLDTGIATRHQDLRSALAFEDNVLLAKDFTNSPEGIGDTRGHGTHVAGIIAASKNEFGVVGVAPMSKLIVGKVISDEGFSKAKWLAEGISWAAQQGADIISISLQFALPEESILSTIKEVISNNTFIICSSGNFGPDLESVAYPAKYDEVIGVGAIDRRQKIWRFSSRGKEVDIVAPGDEILSTYPPNSQAIISGTSMAAPFVAGVSALILSKHRQFGGTTAVSSQSELLEHLKKTALDLGPSGWDPEYGFGLINPEKLLSFS